MSGSSNAAAAQSETREATQARAQAVLAVAAQGWSVAAIAERENLTERRVRQLLTIARGGVAASSSETEPRPAAQPRRMSQRTLLHRAWIAMHLVSVFRELGDAMAMFWLKAVLAIHEAGDGVAVTFGERGDLYESRREFLSSLGRTEAELEGFLRRGLLEEIEGGGLALPYRFGLRPKERTGGKLLPGAAPADLLRPSRKAGVPGQRSFITGIVQGGAEPADGNFRGNFEQVRGNISAENFRVDGNISGNPAEIPEISDARQQGTTTTKKEESQLLGGGGTGSRAVDGNFHEPENFRENFRAGNLARLAKEASSYAAELSAKDIEEAAGWLRHPWPEEFILRTIREDRAKPHPKPVYALRLFTAELEAAWELEKAKATAPPAAAPAPALAPDDQALSDRLRATKHAHPPSLADFHDPAQATAARRWLETFEAWDKAGRPRDTKLPDFTLAILSRAIFEADMLAVEEALTEPDAG